MTQNKKRLTLKSKKKKKFIIITGYLMYKIILF